MNFFQLLIRLIEIYDRVEGQTLTRPQILSRIRRAIPFKECKVVSNYTLNVQSNRFDVIGVYFPEIDEDGLAPIELEVAMPKHKSSYTFDDDDLTKEDWVENCIDLACTLGHEFVHMEQFRRRQFRYAKEYGGDVSAKTKSSAQLYYGNPDEIDAYAFIAAANMSISLMTHGRPTPIETTNVYILYKRLFDKKHPIVLKLTRLGNRYYKRLEKQYYDTYR